MYKYIAVVFKNIHENKLLRSKLYQLLVYILIITNEFPYYSALFGLVLSNYTQHVINNS